MMCKQLFTCTLIFELLRDHNQSEVITCGLIESYKALRRNRGYDI